MPLTQFITLIISIITGVIIVTVYIVRKLTTCEQKILKLEEKNGDMRKEITKIEERVHKIYERAYNNVNRDLTDLPL